MAELKLAKLPDRIPVRISITVSPALDKKLQAYADAYREAYGAEEKVNELIPFILEQFLDADRGFARAKKDDAENGSNASRRVTRKRVQTNSTTAMTS